MADRDKRSGIVHIGPAPCFVRHTLDGIYTVRANWTTYRGLEWEDLAPLFASIAEQVRATTLTPNKERARPGGTGRAQ